MTIAIYTGGRDLVVGEEYWPVLDTIRDEHGITEMWHGACPFGGADEGAERWALAEGIPVERFPAPWDLYTRAGMKKGAAGPRRIEDMLAGRRNYVLDGRNQVVTTEDLGRTPSLIVAFPGGSGTRRTVREGTRLGMVVERAQLEPMVVNRHHYPDGMPNGSVYIGRGTPLGNPYRVKPARERRPGDMEACMAAYKHHLWRLLKAKDPAVLQALDSIRTDSLLVCSCKKPDGKGPCHGDVVLAAWLWMQRQQRGSTLQSGRSNRR